MSKVSKAAAAVQRQTARLRPGDRITVVPLHAPEEFGIFSRSDQQGFTFYDVDAHADTTLTFAAVRKVKPGYGGFNFVQNRH